MNVLLVSDLSTSICLALLVFMSFSLISFMLAVGGSQLFFFVTPAVGIDA